MANQNHFRSFISAAMVPIAARHGESSRLKSRKEKAAAALGNQEAMAWPTTAVSSEASEATCARTPIVETMDSFAVKPEIDAATGCHSPKPSGRKMTAIAPPTAARTEEFGLSTSPKCPPSIPKLDKNHMTRVAMKRTVPAFFRKAFSLSQTCIRTPFMEGIKAQPYGDKSANTISKLIELQQYYKASMFNDIGLNSNYNMKRETIVSAEIELNADALFPFVDDMLICRQRALEEVNKLFGTDIRVELNSSWEDLADSREVQDVLEEAEALAAIGGETDNSMVTPADDMELSNRLDDSEDEVTTDETSVDETSEADEDNADTTEQNDEQQIQEEQDESSDAVDEIKDALLEKIADVVDDGTEDQPLEEVVEELLDNEEESNQLDNSEDTDGEESNRLDKSEESDEDKDDDEETE